jgi:hypothetical protein
MHGLAAAKAAATARIGYSSIMLGARSGRHGRRRSAPNTGPVMSPTGSPPASRLVLDRDVRAHLAQRVEQAGPQRV